jgi:hypothetical protein
MPNGFAIILFTYLVRWVYASGRCEVVIYSRREMLFCLASFASPCGPSGRASINTQTIENAPCADSFLGLTAASYPREFNSPLRASAISRARGSGVLLIVTPVMTGSMGFPNAGSRVSLMEIADGGETCHPATVNVCAISVANDVISASYETRPMLPHWPANRLRGPAILDCCSLVMCLQATRSSIFARASASSSARLRREAASFSFLEARSSALAARSKALPARSSASPAFWRASPASLLRAAIRAAVATLTSFDRESILRPYGYAQTSARTATAKHTSAILSSSSSRFLFKCASTSNTTSANKKANRNSL